MQSRSISILFRLTILTGLFLIAFGLDVFTGSVSINVADVFSYDGEGSVLRDILLRFRLPKAVTCILAGASLATGGLLMQTLFRNPLAGPDVLGLSSGASLMVSLVVMAGQSGGILHDILSGPWAITLAASMGGALVFLLMTLIANHLKDNTALLIVGLMVSAATASFVSILQFISKAEDLQTFIIWSMGNVGGTNWLEIKILALVLVVAISITIAQIKPLNSWLLGENYAQSLGVNLKKSRLLIVLSTGLLVGGVTAFCGPIAFVGLAVPHLVRMLIPTTNHKILIPTVMIGGATLLLICDVIAQMPQQILPINAITSLVGAPIVIWVIVMYKKVRV